MSILNANCDGHTVIRNQDSEDITRPYGARNRKVTPARVKSESKSTVVSQNTPRTAFPSVTRVSLPSSPTVPTENVAPVKVETTANLDRQRLVLSVSNLLIRSLSIRSLLKLKTPIHLLNE